MRKEKSVCECDTDSLENSPHSTRQQQAQCCRTRGAVWRQRSSRWRRGGQGQQRVAHREEEQEEEEERRGQAGYFSQDCYFQTTTNTLGERIRNVFGRLEDLIQAIQTQIFVCIYIQQFDFEIESEFEHFAKVSLKITQ